MNIHEKLAEAKEQKLVVIREHNFRIECVENNICPSCERPGGVDEKTSFWRNCVEYKCRFCGFTLRQNLELS